jgi:hypothetical protein
MSARRGGGDGNKDLHPSSFVSVRNPSSGVSTETPRPYFLSFFVWRCAVLDLELAAANLEALQLFCNSKGEQSR